MDPALGAGSLTTARAAPDREEVVTPDIVESFLRLPRAERGRAAGVVMAPDGRTVSKTTYRVNPKNSVISEPQEGTYQTCTPANHSKQVGLASDRGSFSDSCSSFTRHSRAQLNQPAAAGEP